MAVTVGLTLGGFAAAVGATAAIAHSGERSHDMVLTGPRSLTVVPLGVAEPSSALQGSTTHQGGARLEGAYRSWAAGVAARVDVPARALSAYAVAALEADDETPGCHLNWATLAGIGYVESRNGELGGGLQASGEPRRPIYGVQLNGHGPVAAVPDSDDGSIDADTALDRAVGPLQFLPSTWQTWGTDGDGDGASDPQDLDDAAVAAARYLCATGGLDTADGWTDAVLSYNHSGDYLDSVFAATQAIAAGSRD